MRTETGTRVIAILSADETEVTTFGEGTYVGDEVPPAEVNALFHKYQIPNPRIELDSGGTVWGFECWWGPAEQMRKKMYNGREIVELKGDEWQKEQGGG